MKRKVAIACLGAVLSFSAMAQTRKRRPAPPPPAPPAPTQPPVAEKGPPIVVLSTYNLDFGDQATQSASKSQRITVTNSGETPLYINSVAINQDNRQDFALANDSCTGVTLDSQKSCVVDVSFMPYENGHRKSALTITDNAVDSPQKVVLTGKGINSSEVPPSRAP